MLVICVQMIMLEGAKATTETVDALRTGAAAMKAMQKATYVAAYYEILDDFLLTFFVDLMLLFGAFKICKVDYKFDELKVLFMLIVLLLLFHVLAYPY